MKWIPLSILTFAAVGLTGIAEDRWQVTAHLDVFQLPEKEALSFIPRLSDPKEAASALTSLSEKATDPGGKTRRMATLTARTLDGQHTVYRSGEERRYPVEYEQEDSRIGVPMDTPVKLPDATGYPSTTFETRNCGVRLELSATVHPNGETMSLLCTVEHILFDRWTRYETAVRADGMKLFIEQPEFIDRSTTTPVLATSGKPVLVGSYRMSEKEGTFELHVLLATARRIDLNGIMTPGPDPLAGGENSTIPVAFPKRDRRLELLSFSVSAREAITLRGQLLNEEEAARALGTLIAQVGTDSVKLIDWQTVPSLATGRAVTRNERQFRYGIEIRDPQVAGPISVPEAEARLEPATTFETRFLGTLLEVECELKDNPHSAVSERADKATPGSYDRLQLKASNGNFSRFFRWGAGPDQNGKISYVYQPQFEYRVFSGSLAIEHGKPLMVRFAKEPGASNRFEIAILRAHDRPPQK